MAKSRKSTKPRRSRRKTRQAKPTFRQWLIRSLLKLSLVVFVVLLAYLSYLDVTILSKFDGRKWELPARVYARPMELYSGAPYSRDQVLAELRLLGYRQSQQLDRPGSYQLASGRIALHSRAFHFWDGQEPARRLTVHFNADGIDRLTGRDGEPLPLLRLDPLAIGGIYPQSFEDRILIQRDEVPALLIKGLLSVEDKAFYEHHGVAPTAILRAVVSNIKAGRTVQGGSTLTQQLVKSFYLSSERTLRRKLTEAMMALLLELHYDKDEILLTYLNEVYLGQAGERAIHGIGMASHFYYERPLGELDLPRLALLVGIIKGPSWYNPRLHPERAKERRNLVLDVMQREGVISAEQAARAKQAPLGVTRQAPSGSSRYPAFMQLLKLQLRRDYQAQDLQTEGLKVFTTLDPLIQQAAEKALHKRLQAIEKSRNIKADTLQGAIVTTASHNGEVLALVGGREAHYSGFNRALNARRQVGSLLKPAIYATAYDRPDEYSMVSWLDDSPLQVVSDTDEHWQPQNYDQEFHGRVPLYAALAHSYNVSSARLGMTLGLEQVFATLRDMGIERDLPAYPSVLLGAAELTPLEVTRMYLTLSSNGFRTPIRAIREVLDVNNQALQRYPIQIEQVLKPATAYLTNASLIEVMRSGTGRSLYRNFPADLVVAGKTGTTNELRDSWFAGFTNDKLSVVWIGNDENRPIGLTGSSGAMQVWGEVMRHASVQSLRLTPPNDIEFLWIEQASGKLADAACPGAVKFPFIKGSAPPEPAACIGGGRGLEDTIRSGVKSFWEQLFGD